MSSRITRKGQVTIPRHVRDAAGLGTGDRVDFVIEPTGRIVLQHADRRVRLERALERVRQEPPIKSLTAEDIMGMTRGHDR